MELKKLLKSIFAINLSIWKIILKFMFYLENFPCLKKKKVIALLHKLELEIKLLM